MFYYYGGKANIAGRYPVPRGRVVVEPFAGAAGYSMHHLERGNIDRVFLVEKDQRVANLWKRLLEMTPSEVLALPVPQVGDQTDDFFYMTTATSNGVASSQRMTVTSRMPREIERQKRRVARLLPFCQGRVTITSGDYETAPRLSEATYFVDPPYQPHADKATSKRTGSPQGMGYGPGCRASDLDYEQLGYWVTECPAHIIVAEQAGADWLPFHPLIEVHDAHGKPKKEVMWTRGRKRSW